MQPTYVRGRLVLQVKSLRRDVAGASHPGCWGEVAGGGQVTQVAGSLGTYGVHDTFATKLRCGWVP